MQMGSVFSVSTILIISGVALFLLGILALPGISKGPVVRGGARERGAIFLAFMGILVAIVGLILKWAVGI